MDISVLLDNPFALVMYCIFLASISTAITLSIFCEIKYLRRK